MKHEKFIWVYVSIINVNNITYKCPTVISNSDLNAILSLWRKEENDSGI